MFGIFLYNLLTKSIYFINWHFLFSTKFVQSVTFTLIQALNLWYMIWISHIVITILQKQIGQFIFWIIL